MKYNLQNPGLSSIIVLMLGVMISAGAPAIIKSKALITSSDEEIAHIINSNEEFKEQKVELKEQPLPKLISFDIQKAEARVQNINKPIKTAGSSYVESKLYVDENSLAAKQYLDWKNTKPNDAEYIRKISENSTAVWLSAWSGDIKVATQNITAKAKSKNQIPVFVAYNIPNRDCGGYSAGGVQSSESYERWINSLAEGIGYNSAIVILEPDALALTECLTTENKKQRFDLLTSAVKTLKRNSKTKVYLDAGHSNWISVKEMASRLTVSGIQNADGFALNVSNFRTTAESIGYGNKISTLVGNKHYIIDTSRNGNGPKGSEWCNPSGRALGERPTLSTGKSLVDAYLWVKKPGESDGNCNGGKNAGEWWSEYALELAKNAAW